jgi:hypothetical protein
MKPMKLHLYESFYYTCIPEKDALFEMDRTVKRIKEQIGTDIDEELAVFSQESQAFEFQGNSQCAGLGPIPQEILQKLPASATMCIPEGDYLFYQFPDASAQGIRDALTFLISYAKANSIPLQEQRSIILRGVKETGFYVPQLLLPLRSQL